MADRIHRREFLIRSSRGVLGCAILPFLVRWRPTDSAASESLSVTQIRELEEVILMLMRQGMVPGLSIAVIKNAELVWRRGFGFRDMDTRAPVDGETVFEAASVSKTVFAYAVLKLCERGIIGLDTPRTEYTSERFLQGDPRLDQITARHVLSHTSGFQNWRSDDEPLRIHFTPGERYQYSGEGYSYLQSVMTRLTGQPFDPYMRKNLLLPFGMASSGYLWNRTFDLHAARPHDGEGKPLAKNRPTEETVARYGAAGELHTTPTDYARFLIEILDPKPSDAFRLGRESLSEMVRPQVEVEDGVSCALGWQIRHTAEGDLIQHQGWNRGFQAFAAASVEKRSGFVLMTNGDNGWKVFDDPVFGETMSRFLEA